MLLMLAMKYTNICIFVFRRKKILKVYIPLSNVPRLGSPDITSSFPAIGQIFSTFFLDFKLFLNNKRGIFLQNFWFFVKGFL